MNKLDLAIAQITGYKEAKKGSSIEDLFDSMGLTEKAKKFQVVSEEYFK